MSKKSEERKGPAREAAGEDVLIRRAIGGEVEAYGVLVEAYQQRVFNLIGRMVGRREVVEDLAQEVFIKAFRKLSGFRFESSFYTWIYTIAINTVRNYYRRRGPVMVALEGHEGADESAASDREAASEAPDEVVYRRQRAVMVRNALEQIPPEQKEVLILCDLEGLSYQEIADITGVPVGTVRSRIFRARANLRELLPEDVGSA